MCQHNTTSDSYSSHSREPADPHNPDHNAREQLPLAPDTVDLDGLPDELHDGDRPQTVGEAAVTYLKICRSNMNESGMTSKHERHKQLYGRLLRADRRLQEEYDGLTTVMLTRRLSPLSEDREWLTPWECNEMLHGGPIRGSIHRALGNQLENFRYKRVGVTAPTAGSGTPHEHIYLWIEDPNNEITTAHIKPALDKHLKYCANAYEEDHTYRVDGSHGAITYRYDPETKDGGETVGAGYVAQQLAHLPIGDMYDATEDNPAETLIQGAAVAWATKDTKWFVSSRGV